MGILSSISSAVISYTVYSSISNSSSSSKASSNSTSTRTSSVNTSSSASTSAKSSTSSTSRTSVSSRTNNTSTTSSSSRTSSTGTTSAIAKAITTTVTAVANTIKTAVTNNKATASSSNTRSQTTVTVNDKVKSTVAKVSDTLNKVTETVANVASRVVANNQSKTASTISQSSTKSNNSSNQSSINSKTNNTSTANSASLANIIGTTSAIAKAITTTVTAVADTIKTAVTNNKATASSSNTRSQTTVTVNDKVKSTVTKISETLNKVTETVANTASKIVANNQSKTASTISQELSKAVSTNNISMSTNNTGAKTLVTVSNEVKEKVAKLIDVGRAIIDIKSQSLSERAEILERKGVQRAEQIASSVKQVTTIASNILTGSIFSSNFNIISTATSVLASNIARKNGNYVNTSSLVKNMSNLTKDKSDLSKEVQAKAVMQKIYNNDSRMLESVLCYKEGDITYYKDNSGNIYKVYGNKTAFGKENKVDENNYKYVPKAIGGTREDNINNSTKASSISNVSSSSNTKQTSETQVDSTKGNLKSASKTNTINNTTSSTKVSQVTSQQIFNKDTKTLEKVLCYQEGNTTYYKDSSGNIYKVNGNKTAFGKENKVSPNDYIYIPKAIGGTRADSSSQTNNVSNYSNTNPSHVTSQQIFNRDSNMLESVLCYQEGGITYYKDTSGDIYKVTGNKTGFGEENKVAPSNYKYIPKEIIEAKKNPSNQATTNTINYTQSINTRANYADLPPYYMLYDPHVPDVVKNSIKNTSWYQELEGRDLEGLSKEIILGKYYGRVTPEGTVINLALGFTGLDFILDARDLFYDITHWENSMDHVKETGLDFISLAPGFGAIKYSDEAAELISAGRKGLKAAESTSTIGKKINNATELSTTLVKNSDEMGELAGAATKSIKNTKEAAKVTANSGSEIIDSTGTAIKNGNITAEANKVAVNSGDELTEVSTKITKNNEKIIKGTSKTGFKTQQLLDSHFKKHAAEFGNITKQQYLKGAQDLVSSKPGGNILTKVRPNGDTIFYNKATNEFAVKTSDGIIRTYFKPTDGINYFNRQ